MHLKLQNILMRSSQCCPDQHLSAWEQLNAEQVSY